MVLKDDNVAAEWMSSGRLFHVTGPATLNARLLKTEQKQAETVVTIAAELTE